MSTLSSQNGGVPQPPKYVKIKNDPVLLFDNKSKDSHSFELLTIPETARLLKISVTAVRRLQQRRCLPFIKVGGSVRFAINDITSYLLKQRVESIE
jgi:excisionase family DNA binding protein